MMTQIDQLGSQIFSASSRDFIQYQSTVFPQSLPLAVSLLSSTILHPLLLAPELEEAKASASYEIREAWAKAPTIMQEVVHSTAFGGKTLGMPTICPETQLGRLGEDEFRGYMRDWYRPERMVVAGYGIPHEELVELVEKHFGELPAPASTASPSAHQGRSSRPSRAKTFATVSSAPITPQSLQSDFAQLLDAKAIYTGGQTFIDRPDEEFVHLFIGFESLHATDPEVVSSTSSPCSGADISTRIVRRGGDELPLTRRLFLLARRSGQGHVLATPPKRPQPPLPGRSLSIPPSML